MKIIAEYEYFVLTLYRLCPELIQIPLNFDKYTAKAQEVREILVEYDPRFESASIDEAVGPFPSCLLFCNTEGAGLLKFVLTAQGLLSV